MSGSLLAFGETAGGFYNDFSADFAPGNFCRVGRRKYLNAFAVYNDAVAVGSYLMGEGAMHGIIFQ